MPQNEDAILELHQLQPGDKLSASNAKSRFAGVMWFVGVVSLSQRFVLLAQCGKVENRLRASEWEFNQAKFILKGDQKRESKTETKSRKSSR